MTEIVLWAVTVAMLIYGALEVRAIWVTRRQPVRQDAPIEGVWMTPEPRVRRHG